MSTLCVLSASSLACLGSAHSLPSFPSRSCSSSRFPSYFAALRPESRVALRSAPRLGMAVASGDKSVELKNVDVDQAKEMLGCGSHRYLDVRAPEVFATGNVDGAHNIPYYNPESDKVKDIDFEQKVSSVFNKEDGIIVGCGTGNRSVLAASDLVAAGFKNVYNMAGGYRAMNNSKINNKE